MSFFYDQTMTVKRASSPGGSVYAVVASGVATSIQQRKAHAHTGYDNPDTDGELWRILPDPASLVAYQVGDRLEDDQGRVFLARGAELTPLGWQLTASDWTVAGTSFPTRALYVVERTAATTQDANGLPIVTAAAPLLVTPAPMVRYGGHLMIAQGGGTTQLGEIEVSNLDRMAWPPSRLLGALGFHVDTASGELYQIAMGRLEDAGVSTLRFWLERASQPRA